MDIEELKKIHIHPRYELAFDPRDLNKIRDILRKRPAAVLFAAVGSSHRRSSRFCDDIRRFMKAYRKHKPATAEELERLLWHNCEDKALKCPFRPDAPRPRLIITAIPESKEEYGQRIDETRKEWLRLMGELLDAMQGRRACEVVEIPIQN